MTKRNLNFSPSEDTVKLLNKKRSQSTVLPTLKPGNSLCICLFTRHLAHRKSPWGISSLQHGPEGHQEHPSRIQEAGKWREPPGT